MYSFINLLRLFACLLITNFHFDLLYPERLRILAFGGDLGNNLFFLISGFCLYSSVNEKDFGQWLKKRYGKILPAVLLMELLSAVLFGIGDYSLPGLVQMFLFPTIFWFTGAIIWFYPIFYLVCKGINRNRYLFYLIVCFGSVVQLAFDGLFAERYVVGFLAMLTGYCLYGKLTQSPVPVVSRNISRLSGVCSVLVFLCYVLLKLFRMKQLGNTVLIHYGVGMTSVVFAVFLVITFFYLEQAQRTQGRSCKKGALEKLVSGIDASTLQIYLLQSIGERYLIRLFEKILFPVNYILCLCLIFMAAYLLKLIGDRFRSMVLRSERERKNV